MSRTVDSRPTSKRRITTPSRARTSTVGSLSAAEPADAHEVEAAQHDTRDELAQHGRLADLDGEMTAKFGSGQNDGERNDDWRDAVCVRGGRLASLSGYQRRQRYEQGRERQPFRAGQPERVRHEDPLVVRP